MGWLRDRFRSWLEILPVENGGLGLSIFSEQDFEREVFRNKIWYRGNAGELAQLYAMSDDLVGNRSFWAAGGASAGIRKLHSGLPALIVDTLGDIAVNDLIGVRVSEEGESVGGQELWDAIALENNFGRLLLRAVRKALALGDGAFKISFDEGVSDYPIIEFFGADKVRFEYSRGRIEKVVFLRNVGGGGGRGRGDYLLEEIYGACGIDYRLIDGRGDEVSLAGAGSEAVKGLVPVKHTLGMNLAVPLIFDENPRFEGRGRSIFDSKIGAFDALDEVLSQWIDALRDGRAQKYIPVGLLPRNPKTGEVMGLGVFESRFIQTEMDMAEGADNSIKVVQPGIDTAALAESCANYLTFALQGIVAPATLGIDLKRRDNAEAQREKEKATMYTRGKLVAVLREVVGRLAVVALAAHDAFHNKAKVARSVAVEFGEYAAPNFESQIETVGKGRQMGVMSIENAVEQLYGNTWSKEQKAEEVARIRAEARG